MAGEGGGRFNSEPNPESNSERFIRQIENCGLEAHEVAEVLKQIEYILIKLFETGPELDIQIVKHLRSQLQTLILSLGLDIITESGLPISLVDDLAVIYSYLSNEAQKRIKPDWYPEISDFAYRLYDIDQNPPETVIPNKIIASDVAKYAKIDPQLEGRAGLSLAEYLHNLGLMMLNRHAYQSTVGQGDEIKINDNWKVTNGRHRATVLRLFGTKNVEKSGMNNWVKVKLESDLPRRLSRLLTG